MQSGRVRLHRTCAKCRKERDKTAKKDLRITLALMVPLKRYAFLVRMEGYMLGLAKHWTKRDPKKAGSLWKKMYWFKDQAAAEEAELKEKLACLEGPALEEVLVQVESPGPATS